jgi:hypothetical protein
MTDVWFVVAGWGVIVGGIALYAATLLRRLRSAEERSLRVRREAESAPPLEERR